MLDHKTTIQKLEDLLWFAYNDIRRSPKTADASFQKLYNFMHYKKLNPCSYCFGAGVIYSGSPTDDRECEECNGFGLILTER